MDVPEIVLVVMPGNGGKGLIVNNTVVAATFGSYLDVVLSGGDLGKMATKLAESLGVALHTVSMGVPSGPGWEWDDVVKSLPPRERPSTNCQPGLT